MIDPSDNQGACMDFKMFVTQFWSFLSIWIKRTTHDALCEISISIIMPVHYLSLHSPNSCDRYMLIAPDVPILSPSTSRYGSVPFGVSIKRSKINHTVCTCSISVCKLVREGLFHKHNKNIPVLKFLSASGQYYTTRMFYQSWKRNDV